MGFTLYKKNSTMGTAHVTKLTKKEGLADLGRTCVFPLKGKWTFPFLSSVLIHDKKKEQLPSRHFSIPDKQLIFIFFPELSQKSLIGHKKKGTTSPVGEVTVQWVFLP